MTTTQITRGMAYVNDGKGFPHGGLVTADYCSLCHRRGPNDNQEHGDGPCEHKAAAFPRICLSCEHECDYQFDPDHAAMCQAADDWAADLKDRDQTQRDALAVLV